jgi:hypothetical protein
MVAQSERAGREGVPGEVPEDTEGGDRHERRANDQDDSRNRAWQFRFPLVVGLGGF